MPNYLQIYIISLLKWQAAEKMALVVFIFTKKFYQNICPHAETNGYYGRSYVHLYDPIYQGM